MRDSLRSIFDLVGRGINAQDPFGDIDPIPGGNEPGDTALIRAARECHKEIALALIDKGACLNAQNRNGETALMEAFSNDWRYQPDATEIAKALIDKGACLDAQNRRGWTALMSAAAQNNREMVFLLIDNGACVDLENEGGKTAIDLAPGNLKDLMEKITPPENSKKDLEKEILDTIKAFPGKPYTF